jgi:hypothetical protein
MRQILASSEVSHKLGAFGTALSQLTAVQRSNEEFHFA